MAEPGARAQAAQPSAVSGSAAKPAAEVTAGYFVEVQAHCGAGFCSFPSDRHDCLAPDSLARVDSIAEHCLAPHSDGRSALAVQTNDCHPCSLPAGYSELAGWEQADSFQA